MTAAEIAELIGRGRYDLTDEKRCQADIATLLASEGVVFKREYRLGARDIVDFLVASGASRVVVEVKMRAAGHAAALRQLARYAEYPTVAAIVLAANRPVEMPAFLAGKPCCFVSQGASWL